jgi:hypothetical protein
MPRGDTTRDAGRRFDYAVVAGVLTGTTGLVLDVRSHIEGVDFAEEGFLTPEHAVIYGGFLAVLGLVFAVTYRNRRAGADWLEAIPRGYRVGVVGLLVFALAGPADAGWHTLFGAEANVEALVSPTHLLLASGGVLFVSSPVRAAWRRADATGWRGLAPAVVAATLVYTVLTVFTLFAHPTFLEAGTGGVGPALGLAAVLLQSALLVGLVLTLVGRFALPPGALALLVGANSAAMAWLGATPRLALAAVVAGVVVDLSYHLLVPGPTRPGRYRLFAAFVPAAVHGAYFGAVALDGALVWTIHLWTGAVALSGAVGLLLSYAVLPTARTDPRRAGPGVTAGHGAPEPGDD